MGRRGDGELERAIMGVVWSLDRPVSGREVVDRLIRDQRVAYTTVLTVMDRLVRKGRLARAATGGRAHSYWATQSQAEFTAAQMAKALGDAPNRPAALLRFVERLGPDAAEQLRVALDAAGQDRDGAPS